MVVFPNRLATLICYDLVGTKTGVDFRRKRIVTYYTHARATTEVTSLSQEPYDEVLFHVKARKVLAPRMIKDSGTSSVLCDHLSTWSTT